jgi:glycosyltransferase involved in cell wall biosynthesis
MEEQPFISIIIPAYNAREHLDRCLDALLASSYASCEIIVVDDGSTDDTAEMARAKGVTVIERTRQAGPGAARNEGALQAKGEILLFIDADVLVTEGTVALVAKRFAENPDVDALFGSYDDNPSEENFLSQYKNLSHHYVHQQSSEEAVTFWAGCGAVRKEVFDRAAGFDQERYARPSIEDIELGYRMKKMGCKILLDKALQVKHLKRWTLESLLRADILHRAVPWSMLMLETDQIVDDLNLQWRSKASACLAGLLFVMLGLALFRGEFLYGAALLAVILVVLNLDFYRFLFHRRGLVFTALSFFMHILYYIYSGLSFVLCWTIHAFSGKKREKRKKRNTGKRGDR